ncbi:MAG: T9SS type A sorting domain-containing protein [Candidatus Edwardsbacteria bacterium]|nr:T9SS type A sorting domain-containing protein [Candidatus Edwardsbacteria bacterium]
MPKKMSTMLMISIVCCFTAATAMAQQKFTEFPIATGDDNTFGGGGAFDGTNFLFAIVGDSINQYNITAQFLSSDGNLYGPRISIGQTGSGPLVAFDGINYLIAWTDSFPMFAGGDTNGTGNIYGQFISTSGSLVGTTFTIASSVNIKFGKGRGGLAFNDTTYLLTYLKGGNHIDYLYGQRINRSGNLIGSPIQISSNYAREHAIAFDGINYLVAWCECAHPDVDNDIFGQFVSPSGTLVGANILIDGGQYASDNPLSMAFDGSRYLVAFHEQANTIDSSGWNILGRFVTTSGAIQDRFTVCDSTEGATGPSVAFDGANYLIAWIKMSDMASWRVQVMGRFFNASSAPLGTAFSIFDTLGGKIPLGGVAYVDGQYLASATRVDTNFAGGDIYGTFIPKYSGVEGKPGSDMLKVESLKLKTAGNIVRYQVPRSGVVSLKIFNLLGQEVRTLANAFKSSGVYSSQWNTCDASNRKVSSGVYLIRLESEGRSATAKMVVVR